jgi:hypothetical protein
VYYAWNWWWFMSWIVPMLLLVWVVFGSELRRGSYYRDGVQRRDALWPGNDGADRDERPKGNRGRGPRNYVRSDARILSDVCDQMTIDEQLDASGIDVDVDRGVVALGGRVETRYAKRRAELIADAVPGVTDVVNKLEIGSLSEAHAGSAAPAHQS